MFPGPRRRHSCDLFMMCTIYLYPRNEFSGVLCFWPRASASAAAAAASAAAAVILLVYAITQTNINISCSNLLEWKIPLQGRTLLSLGEIRFPTWPLGGVFHHENHISFNIFWSESPLSAKPISNDLSWNSLSKLLSDWAYSIFKMAARGRFVLWKSHFCLYLQNGAS